METYEIIRLRGIFFVYSFLSFYF